MRDRLDAQAVQDGLSVSRFVGARVVPEQPRICKFLGQGGSFHLDLLQLLKEGLCRHYGIVVYNVAVNETVARGPE